MSKVPGELVEDPFGGVRFKESGLEQAYQDFGFAQSLADARYTPWIAALLFVLSAPFDYVLIGQGQLTPDVVWCLAVRALTIAALVASGFYFRIASDQAKCVALIFGWAGSVVVIWFLTLQAPPEAAKIYMLLFGLATLSTTSLLPVLNHWQVRTMNAFLFVPIAHTIQSAMALNDPQEIWSFAFAMLILGGTIFFGLYSKRSYDLAMRRDFLLSRDLEQARDEALQADRAKSDFLASASHELRTPLNAIMGNVQLLRKSPSLGPEQDQMLSDAERASRTMTSLVEDVLLISSSGNRVEPQRSPFRLGNLVADLEATVRVLASQKSLKLEMPEGPALDQWVVADEVHLRQILINLLGNAIKFTRTGRVGLRLSPSTDRLRFFVYDTGVGMEAGQVNRAFDPFFRGTNVATAEFAGTGHGLAIVQRLVAEQGGYVRLRSRLDKGSCVYLCLPAKTIATPRLVPKQGAITKLQTSPLRILVIEDEPTNMFVLKRFLTLAGHSVVEATTGAEAIALFQSQAFDCILSDIRLPDISGIDLLKDLTRLAEAAPSGDVPIYAVTANALPSDLERYEDAGFDGYITKPIEETTLLHVLKDVYARKNAIRDFESKVPIALSGILGADEITELYKQSACECSNRLQMAIDTDDLKEMTYLAHRIRGAALTYGDALTAKMAVKLETVLIGDQKLRFQAAIEVEERLRSILNT